MPASTESTWLCQIALCVLALPLLGFAIQVFVGRRLPRGGDWLPTACVLGGLALSIVLVAQLLGAPHGVEAQRWYPPAGLGWMSVGPDSTGGFRLHLGILVDNLTIAMLFVVTLVSFVVHLYSWGYMHGESRYPRFFAYLGLFSFAMLGVCVASNLLVLFIFWELVGVTSYFLIGFWFEKRSAQEACLKAFLTTRIGDLGFLLAILIIGAKVGSLEFTDIFASVERGDWSVPLLTFTGLCLFLGPVGKSAQFPLHIWLPDAMEGPTPVSALIHAATMVAAGVYVVGRMFPFLAGAPYFEGSFQESQVLATIAVVGGFTAFFAATIAFVQTDIKKVLAYSTVSQLGYMMLGLGVGSVTAGLFHLTTHAFFKALLFLGAGSVIHGVRSNELGDMGGLRKKMPITWLTFLVATLAISGLPFLSGFWSKEGILLEALGYAKRHGSFLSALPFAFGAITAGMTAFYMFRLYYSVFHGEPRNHEAHHHAHESPWTMTVPLRILAVLAVISGGFFLPGFDSHWFAARVSSEVLVPPRSSHGIEEAHHLVESGHVTVLALSVGMFVLGVGLASAIFLRGGPLHGKIAIRPGTPLGALHRFLARLWYVDLILVGGAVGAFRILTAIAGAFDRYVVDGLVNAWGLACRGITATVGFFDREAVDGSVRGTGWVTLWLGRRLRRLQTGYLQEYVTASILILSGLFVLSVVVLVVVRPILF